jgi:dipeptidyl aminopeptidase/acylaminoacyl peptidase
MAKRLVAAYGSWKSPITSDLIVAESISVEEPRFAPVGIYWLEQRPKEGGRSVVILRTWDGRVTDVTPAPFNARTRVHEYGGASYTVDGDTIYFTNFADQRLYRQGHGSVPEPLSPAADIRFADFVIDNRRRRIVSVVEDHTIGGQYPVNTISDMPLAGGAPRILVGGSDFYSTPRLSPDGTRLAWLSWNHPNMPWDGTELWSADVAGDGTLLSITKVAGGESESIFQPEWSPAGVLHFVSDRSGWWNLYRVGASGVEALCPMDAEFARPQWVFGRPTYAFESSDTILCTYTKNGRWYLARLEASSKTLAPIETPYTYFSSINVLGGQAVFVAGGPTDAPAIVLMDLKTLRCEAIRCSTTVTVDPGYISAPEPMEFPTKNGLTSHAIYYPPANRDYAGPSDELPPLIVHSHGGPTAAFVGVLSLSTQYWTSRGIAVVDVNYGGSTGYGRAYRERLNGQWGVVDVDDCVNAARHLVRLGRADGKRLAIAGGSAGGYTTLCALVFTKVFAAGASHYGVSDAEALAKDTHKFESRYLDRLIGPYPSRRDLYLERSPVYFTDRLSCPVIFFQGLEDKIVPPDQAERMVEALKAKGLPVAYVAFEGEQHGFRKAENIRRALDGELYFYSRVFGFRPAGEIEPVQIYNLA